LGGRYYITGVEIPETKAKELNDANFYSNPTVHRYHDSLNSSGMLAGYAIETLLKCCLAIINLETGGEMLPNHYLKEHAKKINEEWKISLETEEAEFLDQMEAYIRWKARYPASTSGKEKFDNRPIEVTGLYANLRKIWLRYYDALSAHNQNIFPFSELYSREQENDQILRTSKNVFDSMKRIVELQLIDANSWL
jgi:hypothetical protein